MTIREMEYQSGLDRANIRFYEREGLLTRCAGRTATGTTARRTCSCC